MNSTFSFKSVVKQQRQSQVASDPPHPADERELERSPRRLNIMHHVFTLLPPVLPGVLLLGVWYLVATSGQFSRLIVPAPGDVWASLVDGLQSGLYGKHIWLTVQGSLSGFLLALVIALPLGYGVAKSRLVARTIQPYLAAGQAIPAIVIAPFLFLWLGGNGILAVTIVCMLLVLFPLVVNTILGVQTIERSLLEAARVEGAKGWSLLAHIEFPLSLPALVAAVRTCLTLSITGAVVGEFVCTPDRGLGGLVQIAMNQFNTTFMFATVFVLATLAAFYYTVTWGLVKLAEALY